MLVPLLMTVAGLLTSPAMWSARPIHCHEDIASEFSWHEHAVLAAFDQSIQDYMDLHQRLARARPPLTVTADPAQLRDAIDSLGQAIQLARLSAQPGDIFTAAVARVLRRRIHRALWAFDMPVLISEIGEDDEADTPTPVVNGPFPWSVDNAMWPSVLAALPQLPEELEYRFAGTDLVLIDIPANLVIDILDGALTPCR